MDICARLFQWLPTPQSAYPTLLGGLETAATKFFCAGRLQWSRSTQSMSFNNSANWYLQLFSAISYLIQTRLYHPPDGITNPKYKLLCFLTTIFCKEKKELAFNQDWSFLLALSLWLILFELFWCPYYKWTAKKPLVNIEIRHSYTNNDQKILKSFGNLYPFMLPMLAKKFLDSFCCSPNSLQCQTHSAPNAGPELS
jgi:hypothetical protein